MPEVAARLAARLPRPDYGSSTTAGSFSAGDVLNYLKDVKVQQGQAGTAILLREKKRGQVQSCSARFLRHG